MRFGAESYRAGAMERIGDAALLLENGHVSGAVYSAGLAVECMLRSLVWLKDRRFDERHDLRRLAVRIESLGLLRGGEIDEGFVGVIENVAARWHNNLRFAASDHLLRLWSTVGVVRKRASGNMKTECREFVNQCAAAVRRCEVLWQRQQRRALRKS